MTTVTLKNIPDEIYQTLKAAATAHHRSMNSEIIACLEQILLPTRVSADERLHRAKQLRAGLNSQNFSVEDIADAIEQGRA